MKFVHIVDNWDVENWEKYNSFLETQEIIPVENVVKVFLYHGGFRKIIDNDDNTREYSDVCICYEYICPIRGSMVTAHENYDDTRDVFKKFNSLVETLCGTWSFDRQYPHKHNRFYNEIKEESE